MGTSMLIHGGGISFFGSATVLFLLRFAEHMVAFQGP